MGRKKSKKSAAPHNGDNGDGGDIIDSKVQRHINDAIRILVKSCVKPAIASKKEDNLKKSMNRTFISKWMFCELLGSWKPNDEDEPQTIASESRAPYSVDKEAQSLSSVDKKTLSPFTVDKEDPFRSSVDKEDPSSSLVDNEASLQTHLEDKAHLISKGYDWTLDMWKEKIVIDGDVVYDFKSIILDVVKEVQVLHLLEKVSHGEITVGNVRIKRTVRLKQLQFQPKYRAKLGSRLPQGFVSELRSDFGSIMKITAYHVTDENVKQLNKGAAADWNSFMETMQKLYNGNEVQFPSVDFVHLHPFLLNTNERLALRYIGYENGNFGGLLEVMRVGVAYWFNYYKVGQHKRKWKALIPKGRLQNLESYTKCSDNELGFMAFSRIAVVHVNEMNAVNYGLALMGALELETILTAAFPRFLSIWSMVVRQVIGYSLITLPNTPLLLV